MDEIEKIPGTAGVDVALYIKAFDEADIVRNADCVTVTIGDESDKFEDVDVLGFIDGLTLGRTGGGAGPFDEDFYLSANPDVAEAVAAGAITAAEHYEMFGQAEGRDPNPLRERLFDEDAYLAANPDVAAAVDRGEVTAWGHYDTVGWEQGLLPSALFDGEAYLAANSDVADAGINPLIHFIAYGAAEGRLAIPVAGGIEPTNLGQITLDGNAGEFDVEVDDQGALLIGRFTGDFISLGRFDVLRFDDRSFTFAELEEAFGPEAAVPFIQVGGGTQVVTVNDTDPTISVVWDRTVQQAVIDTEEVPVGPTVASRAYAMVHTAMYDAWASYDDTAVRVSFDQEGDNAGLEAEAVNTDDNKAKAMSFAALTVLQDLFPDQGDLFATVHEQRLGYSLEDDDSPEAAIGIDAAEDLLALRSNDGSNETVDYTPVNPNPLEINDITRWTPENVPIDPEDTDPEQSFLTPQWPGVESFALPETADGSTDFEPIRPPPPQPFFTEAFAGSVLNFDDGTITVSAPITIDGEPVPAGEDVLVSKDLIGTVINPGFIDQAQQVIDFNAGLTDEQKIIAEFWEDGGGTAFPPGTFMTFGQFVSARDDHTLDQDAQLFLAMGNAVFDSGIATWEAKVFYDYARPVRAIRDLGELGLIGEEGEDELTGETGYVIEAFGGFDPETLEGLGTRTILAENFDTFQRPFADTSPPFAEYTSGHSGFSAAGAEVLRLFTGSDDFGGFVTFAPGSTQFETGVPAEETTLEWPTFSDAADEAGLSRLYGGIHFTEGDVNGRALGREAGAGAYELAQLFITGEATDADRPFFSDDMIMG
ncbi:MAG: calcium-binding protein [Alphaproteobacteria bacterium]|jgi:hypothetical protein|nr:calcium-binding protein [Alphaproteobacteria bacterium]